MRRSNLLLLCLAIATLAGCGQKGPLTMPPAKPTPAASTVAKPVVPAPASTVAPANPSGSNIPDGDQN
jgi:predicted small lipoprotein YifL